MIDIYILAPRLPRAAVRLFDRLAVWLFGRSETPDHGSSISYVRARR